MRVGNRSLIDIGAVDTDYLRYEIRMSYRRLLGIARKGDSDLKYKCAACPSYP